MAHNLLGDTIDIHAGGADLVFPHHENEVAQSEGRSGKTFANYWMHSAYLNVNNVKMSKSLNNFFTTRDILEKYDAEVVRLFMLSGHYRTPLNFTMELLDSTKSGLDRMYNALNNLYSLLDEVNKDNSDDEFLQVLDGYRDKFIEKMDDDFNTADAISVIFDLVKDINIKVNINSSVNVIEKSIALLRELGAPLGILQKEISNSLEAEVENLIAERQKARQEKNWALADEIRDKLKAMDIILEDTPQGVRWSKKS